MHLFRALGAVVALAGIALVVGCGDEGKTADVSGTVTYDGKEIEDGSITFYPADGKGQTGGGIIKNGRYTATKVPIGATKVVISSSKVVGHKKLYPTPDSPTQAVTAEALPAKYSDKDKSELSFEVKRGQNEKNWELAK
jgi:hypothetical protein